MSVQGCRLFFRTIAVLTCLHASAALAYDHRSAIPADVLAKVEAMTIDEQFQALSSPDNATATVALFELTRDDAATFSNSSHLVTVAEAMPTHLKADCNLMRAVDPISFAGTIERRENVTKRTIHCVLEAQDGPARWHALDQFFDHMQAVTLNSSSKKERVQALDYMFSATGLSTHVDNARGTDRVIAAAKHMIKDSDASIRNASITILCAVAAYNRSLTQDVIALLQSEMPREEADAVVRSLKERIEFSVLPRQTSEAEYREAIKNAATLLSEYAQNGRSTSRVSTVAILDYIISDPNRVATNYDLLLKVAAYGEFTRTIGLSLARRLPDSATPEEKSRTDKLLDMLEKVRADKGHCDPYILGQFLLPRDVMRGRTMVEEGKLLNEPIYAQERVIRLLFEQIHNDNRSVVEQAATILERAAWIDPGTARRILDTVKKSAADIETNPHPWKALAEKAKEEEEMRTYVREYLQKAIQSAEEAVAYYATVTASQNAPSKEK